MEELITRSPKRDLEDVEPGNFERRYPAWWVWLAILFCGALIYLAGWMRWPIGQAPVKPGPGLIVDKAIPCKPGPWGNLAYQPIYIEPPTEYLPVTQIETSSRAWKFESYTPGSLRNFLDSTSLTEQQKYDLMMTCTVLPGGTGVSVTPTDETVLSMDEATRSTIYNVVARTQGNGAHDFRAFFPPDKFDDFFSHSGLSPETVKLVRRLSFKRGPLLFFCDVQVVLAGLQSPAEKVRLLKTIYRKSTLLMRIQVYPDSDINALSSYWSRGAWGKDIRPMLESLSRVDGGARAGIVHLIPPLPGGNLYTFPFPSLKPEDNRKDCHWTAFNFFRDPPDPRLSGEDASKIQAIQQILENDYYPVASEPRYGDLVELFRPNGELIHSSVYIADDIVYTKNSGQFLEPFQLMKQQEMIDAIATNFPADEQLQVRIFRNKYY